MLVQVILEKLLRSCPRIAHVYVLVRNTDAEPAAKRMEAILATEVSSFLNRPQSDPDWIETITC